MRRGGLRTASALCLLLCRTIIGTSISVSADGSSLRRLTSAPSEEGRPSWSRDGRWIYFYCDRTGRTEIWKVPAEGGEAVQVTTGGGHESFESPDGKLLYYEDFGVKGFAVIPTGPITAQQGTVLLPSVRPGCWAVAEKGIYFAEFDDRNAVAYRALVLGWTSSRSTVSHPIKFYDFRTRKVTQIGTIEKDVLRTAGLFRHLGRSLYRLVPDRPRRVRSHDDRELPVGVEPPVSPLKEVTR